jgi:flavin reductase (DIM6/NTAB) family NADH-FMN oxidoreductase RutF
LKVDLGAKNCLYPLPTVLVGALVNGKPNYITIAHVGIMDPGAVSLGMNKVHYTNQGIKENQTFSINVPSVAQVKVTDYCGLVSAKQESKSELFQTYYGSLKTAPMIEECALNMECQLVQTVDFPQHDIFIGKVVATHCDESVLTDGVVDLEKLQPILFAMTDRGYYGVGKKFAKAWSIGKDFKK